MSSLDYNFIPLFMRVLSELKRECGLKGQGREIKLKHTIII